MKRFIAPLMMCLTMTHVMAHPGHGEPSPHSHASDLFGLLILAVVLAGIWWEGRK